MPAHHRRFSLAVRLHGKLAAAWATEMLRDRRRSMQRFADSHQREEAAALAIDFTWSIKDGHLHLSDQQGSGSVEHAASVLRELIGLGYVRDPIPIYWSEVRESPVPDAVMAGALLVTRRRTYRFVLPELVEKKARTLLRRRRAPR